VKCNSNLVICGWNREIVDVNSSWSIRRSQTKP